MVNPARKAKIIEFFKKVDTIKIFTEPEAWMLFRVSAIAEATGWTLLLYGIAADQFKLPASRYALPIGGTIHGLLFIAYLLIIITAYSSLGWPRWKALLGITMSVIPGATWAFEVREAHKRRERLHESYRQIIVRAIIPHGNKVLAVQTANSSDWVLPGGKVLLGEKAADALRRIIYELTGVEPKVGEPVHLNEVRNQLEITFAVAASKSFSALDLGKLVKSHDLIDEMKYIAKDDVA